jgi:hypothetical protein
MKEIEIKIRIGKDKIATLIKRDDLTNEDYSIEQILETIGILDHLRDQMLSKLSSIKKEGYKNGK